MVPFDKYIHEETFYAICKQNIRLEGQMICIIPKAILVFVLQFNLSIL